MGVPDAECRVRSRASGDKGLVGESCGVGLSACRDVDHDVDGL